MSTSTHTPTPWEVFIFDKGSIIPFAILPAYDGLPPEESGLNGGCDIAHLHGPDAALNAAFIINACNAHDDLVAMNAALREDLDGAHGNWEIAVEAGNDVVRQLEAAKLVQQQLVAALTMVRDADNDCASDGLPRIPAIARASIDAALVAAGAA